MNSVCEAVPKPRTRRTARGRQPLALPNNVVVLHQRITAQHRALMARWVAAGQRMGLCDAAAFVPDRPPAPPTPRGDYVLVWVRENIDPAYMVVPEGKTWLVVDAVRQQTLVRTSTFAAALNFIRPVLPLDVAA